jgi:hypothetical protein
LVSATATTDGVVAFAASFLIMVSAAVVGIITCMEGTDDIILLRRMLLVVLSSIRVGRELLVTVDEGVENPEPLIVVGSAAAAK